MVGPGMGGYGPGGMGAMGGMGVMGGMGGMMQATRQGTMAVDGKPACTKVGSKE